MKGVRRCQRCQAARSRELYRKRQEKRGILPWHERPCTDRGAPRDENFKSGRCRDCYNARTRALIAAREAKQPIIRKKKGPKPATACKVCGEDPKPGHALCHRHLTEQRRERNITRYGTPTAPRHVPANAKPCTDCGAPPTELVPGRRQCRKCHRLRQRQVRIDLRARLDEESPDGAKILWTTYRLRKYGLTFESRDKMFADRGGRCAICNRELGEWIHPRDGSGTSPQIDHDHEVGQGAKARREILCRDCNQGIGLVGGGENPEALAAAAAYLRRGHAAQRGTPTSEVQGAGEAAL